MKPIFIKSVTLLLILCALITNADAQKYKSTGSNVHFFSDAPMEDIEAENMESQSAFDLESGDIVFSVPIKAFTFQKSLMQEHFNENYLESDKYPKATFTGKILGYDADSNNWQSSNATGKMTIHGIDHDMSCEGKIKISDDKVEIEAQFPIKLADYKIKIPKVVFYNIAEVVDVTIKFQYEKIN